MALEYDGKRVTRDVDAAFAPTLAVREIAAELYSCLGFAHQYHPLNRDELLFVLASNLSHAGVGVVDLCIGEQPDAELQVAFVCERRLRRRPGQRSGRPSALELQRSGERSRTLRPTRPTSCDLERVGGELRASGARYSPRAAPIRWNERSQTCRHFSASPPGRFHSPVTRSIVTRTASSG